MSALAQPRTRRTAAPCARRFRDVDGHLVTYLTARPLTDLLNISMSTLHRWTSQGLVRTTEPLRGVTNYAIIDAARIKKMTRQESQALGIRRYPDRDTAIVQAWYEEAQAITLPAASSNGDEWDSVTEAYVIAWVEAGKTVEWIALKLKRSYAAVANRVHKLRECGDLPEIPKDDGTWLDRTTAILTPEEAVALG